MSGVRRVYVEKKEPFAVAARQLKEDIEGFLGIEKIRGVRILIRYDVENISDETFEKGCRTVFSEPPVDDLYKETIEIPEGTSVFSVEALPGQFDQRADSAEQCLQFLNAEEKPVVRTAVTYLLAGDLTKEDVDRIKKQVWTSRRLCGPNIPSLTTYRFLTALRIWMPLPSKNCIPPWVLP